MNRQDLPLTRDIVLIGGGHTHALVLRKWGMSPLAGARLTLINPGPTAPYSGMLPGHVAGHYTRDALDIDLVRLARFAGARLVLGAADGIDTAAKTVSVPGRPPIGYDICAVDVGITSDMPKLPGFAEHAVPAKPLGPFAQAWGQYLATEGPASVAIIGAGVAGVELALAMAHAMKQRGRRLQISVLDNALALRALPLKTARKLRAEVQAVGIELQEGAAISAVESGGVRMADGTLVPADFVTGAAGARAYPWLESSGLTNQAGFLDISPTLQTRDPDVFATGDCAHMTFAPRPKAGVYAVRQAPVLFANLRAHASGKPLRQYRPQDDYLKLISLGGKSALGEKFGVPVSGPSIWRWKNRIDTRFMEQFQSLNPMKGPELPHEHTAGMVEALGPKPLCGGCGAKIGQSGLLAVLDDIAQERPDIQMVPGDDAAMLSIGERQLVMSTDHLRALTEDPVMMTKIAVQHALGDIWAMGGTPLVATVNLILPRLAPDLRDRTMAEIMQTARCEMRHAGAEIVGGHTSTGSELTIGFNVTGSAEIPVTLAGAKPGDVLVLTKPIGSGVIMAGEMQLAAKGAWVAEALAHMAAPQGDAAEVLRHAHAMTDVTGFGLAGHLKNICRASQVGAELDLAKIPWMPGAVDLASAGIRSSLYPENRALAPELPDDGAAALLFDPQTGGGLLAAVAPDTVHAALADLKTLGYQAAHIGRIVAGETALSLQTL